MIFKECNNKILFKLVKDKDKQEEITKKLNSLNLINNILNEIDEINKNSENISISTLKILQYIIDDIEKGRI